MLATATHHQVQALSRAVLEILGGLIEPEDSESSIASRAVNLLAERGVTQTWYHNCPALVLAGVRSCLSESGSRYVANDEPVGLNTVISVDLSPCLDNAWGDCARTYVLEVGRLAASPSDPELAAGVTMQRHLHLELLEVATPRMTGAQLFEWANAEITQCGFQNLDFLKNIGHSIENRIEERHFIDGATAQELGRMGMFTFEPHIGKCRGNWGVKYEEIYHFGGGGRLSAL